mgnify:FL=1
MQRFVKTFDELNVDELYRILAARAAVFVVEQKCPYQDIDGVDRKALHVWREEDGKIFCYLRAFPIADDNSVFQIGRVLSTVRGKGLGARIFEDALEALESRYPLKRIVLEAQCYATGFYERYGFKTLGELFDEDGIPHIRMEKSFTSSAS